MKTNKGHGHDAVRVGGTRVPAQAGDLMKCRTCGELLGTLQADGQIKREAK